MPDPTLIYLFGEFTPLLSFFANFPCSIMSDNVLWSLCLSVSTSVLFLHTNLFFLCVNIFRKHKFCYILHFYWKASDSHKPNPDHHKAKRYVSSIHMQTSLLLWNFCTQIFLNIHHYLPSDYSQNFKKSHKLILTLTRLLRAFVQKFVFDLSYRFWNIVQLICHLLQGISATFKHRNIVTAGTLQETERCVPVMITFVCHQSLFGETHFHFLVIAGLMMTAPYVTHSASEIWKNCRAIVVFINSDLLKCLYRVQITVIQSWW